MALSALTDAEGAMSLRTAGEAGQRAGKATGARRGREGGNLRRTGRNEEWRLERRGEFTRQLCPDHYLFQ